MKKNYFWLTSAIIYCIAIFITTSSSVSAGSSTLFLLTKFLNLTDNTAQIVNVLFRKSVHVVAFGILAILFFNSFSNKRFLKAWFLTTFYAVIDETHQFFLPDRTGSIIDVVIDCLGAILALLILKLIKLKRANI